MRLAIFRRFGSVPSEFTLESTTIFSSLSNAVFRACLAQSRASSRDVYLAEQVWRLQAGFVPPSQEARSPSVPDEGAAFNGWTRSDEGRRKCLLDQVWVCPSCPLEEARRLRQKSPQVERREARVLSRTEHAAPLKGARPRRCAKRRSPPSLEGEGNEGGAPRLTDTRGQ